MWSFPILLVGAASACSSCRTLLTLKLRRTGFAKSSHRRPLTVYAEFKVSHCWYIDPDARTLEGFDLTGGKWLLAATFKDADEITAPPFEAHTFGLDILWADSGE